MALDNYACRNSQAPREKRRNLLLQIPPSFRSPRTTISGEAALTKGDFTTLFSHFFVSP